MIDMSALASNQQDLIGSTCAVCQRATIQEGKTFFPWTNAFLICPACSTEFHRAGEKFVLRKISPNYEGWSRFEGQALSREEIQRIAGGGESDAEVVAAKAAQEEFLQNSQIEGRPEYYYVRLRKILGPLDDSDSEISFTASSKVEAKQQVARIKQIQNELKFLKKEINQQIKQKQLEVGLRGYKRDTSELSGSQLRLTRSLPRI